jgi:hypothetical protein
MNWRGLLRSVVMVLAWCSCFAHTPVWASDEVSMVDLLVAYTPAARDGAGGRQAIESQVKTAVVEANLVFQNSRVGARFRLMHAVEIAYDEAGSVALDLARLRDPQDGFMDDLHQLPASVLPCPAAGGSHFPIRPEDPAELQRRRGRTHRPARVRTARTSVPDTRLGGHGSLARGKLRVRRGRLRRLRGRRGGWPNREVLSGVSATLTAEGTETAYCDGCNAMLIRAEG